MQPRSRTRRWRRCFAGAAATIARCRTAAILLTVSAVVAASAGCHRPTVPDAPPNGEHASTEKTAPSPAQSSPADPGNEITLEKLEALESAIPEKRWLRVEELAEGVDGGWATGNFLPDRNRIEIETYQIAQFVMELPQISVDWSRRVVLKIDGHTSELTRTHYPLLHLRRSPTGGWNPVSKNDDDGQ